MARDDDDEDLFSLSVHQLASSAYRAYWHALDGAGGPPDLDDAEDEVVQFWYRTATHVQGKFRRNGSMSAERAARLVLSDGTESDPHTFCASDVIPAEAAIRHLANLLSMEREDIDSLTEHEANWREWARKRQEKLETETA